jgi:hypothetical protein
MSYLPQDIANRALDSAGVPFTIGDLEEGTREAQILLRSYGECLRQLLRGANWNFARKTAPMTLLGDATGQTPNVGNKVIVPWLYCYALPIDAMKVRFIPWNGPGLLPPVPPTNIQTPQVPLYTGENPSPQTGQRLRPARFTIATDFNYPPPPGQITWEVQGVSPESRTVVLTNVKEALCVYTALTLYPSVWDALFREAMVAYLAAQCCLALHKDKKLALAVRPALIQNVKEKLSEARRVDGDEMWASTDIPVDWMSARRSGGYGGYGGWGGAGAWGAGFGECGVLGYGWDSVGFCDGSAY